MNYLTFLALLISPMSFADGGVTHVGSGGDPVELDFVAFGQMAYSAVLQRSADFPEVSLSAFHDSFATTRVTAVDYTLVDQAGNTKTAINNSSEHSIQVNRALWNALANNERQKMALAFHEFLGILGVETNEYSVSSRLLSYSEPLQENSRIANADGSTTLVKPRFLYHGLPMYIATGDSAAGWCIHEGFSSKVERGSGGTISDEEIAQGIRLAKFHPVYGGLVEIVSEGSPIFRGPYLTWVTCR